MFHTRCPRFIGDICVNEEPPLREVEPGHLWRCHHSLEALRELQKTAPPMRQDGGAGGNGAVPAAARPQAAATDAPAAEARRPTPAAEAPARRAAPGRRARTSRDMRTRAAVLERTGAPLEVVELDLAPPQPGEVLVRLRASGVCHSDLNAIDGTAETRCPAVLGHEGAGVVEAVGAGVGARPGHPRGAVVAAVLRRVRGVPARAAAPVPRGLGRRWPRGGLLDGTPRLSRDGEPVYHYSFLSTFAERTVVPAKCCIPIPDDVPFDVAALVGCAVTTGTGAVWRTAGVRPGDRVAVFGCGGVGLSAVLGAVAAGARPDRRRRRGVRASSRPRWRSARRTRSRGRAAPRRRPSACGRRRGGGVDYAIEATGRTEAARAAFLSTRARGAAVLIGIPAADAELSFPALLDPADGAARARLGLRVGAAGARLPGAARRSTGAAGSRSTA